MTNAFYQRDPLVGVNKYTRTDRYFRYASPYLWNQLSPSHVNLTPPLILLFFSMLPSLPLPRLHFFSYHLSSIAHSLFHFHLKTYLFYKSSPP